MNTFRAARSFLSPIGFIFLVFFVTLSSLIGLVACSSDAPGEETTVKFVGVACPVNVFEVIDPSDYPLGRKITCDTCSAPLLIHAVQLQLPESALAELGPLGSTYRIRIEGRVELAPTFCQAIFFPSYPSELVPTYRVSKLERVY